MNSWRMAKTLKNEPVTWTEHGLKYEYVIVMVSSVGSCTFVQNSAALRPLLHCLCKRAT